jgi:hypothetical protein
MHICHLDVAYLKRISRLLVIKNQAIILCWMSSDDIYMDSQWNLRTAVNIMSKRCFNCTMMRMFRLLWNYELWVIHYGEEMTLALNLLKTTHVNKLVLCTLLMGLDYTRCWGCSLWWRFRKEVGKRYCGKNLILPRKMIIWEWMFRENISRLSFGKISWSIW